MTILSDYFLARTIDDFYKPAMMEFDGSTGYYINTTFTTSSNVVVGVMRFKRASWSGDALECMYAARGPTSYIRLAVYLYSSDFSTVELRSKVSVAVNNTANTAIVRLLSINEVIDNVEHALYFSYDATAGTFIFKIDAIDADDSGYSSRVLTTGTLNTGASSSFTVGANDVSAPYRYGGEIGFVGYHDAYLTNWNDFMDSNGNPKDFDGSSWLFWNEHGNMINNLGSGGNMTENGTIIVGKGGN